MKKRSERFEMKKREIDHLRWFVIDEMTCLLIHIRKGTENRSNHFNFKGQV